MTLNLRRVVSGHDDNGKEPCVIAFVLVAAKPVSVGGKVLNAQG